MNVTNKEIRQFTILKSLSSKASMPAQELSRQLGVSLRTVYRDVEELITNGVTIEGTTGADGGYRLPSFIGDRVQNIHSPEQLSGLFSELVSEESQHEDLWTLPPSRIYIDLSQWLPQGNLLETLRGICESIRTSTAINLKLTTDMRKLLSPYGLIFDGGDWIVIGRTLDDEVISINLNNISELKATDLRFKVPSDFSAERYWKREP